MHAERVAPRVGNGVLLLDAEQLDIVEALIAQLTRELARRELLVVALELELAAAAEPPPGASQTVAERASAPGQDG